MMSNTVSGGRVGPRIVGLIAAASLTKVAPLRTVQDTPGCGDSDDPASERAAVLDYVASCSRAFLDAERDPSRPGSISDLQDVRVDAVLYFFPPHRLRKGDLCFARALAGAAPLVPVLAKADAMTAEELQVMMW